MKKLIYLFLLLNYFLTQAQSSSGGLKISMYKNTNNNLKENILLDSILVNITNNQSKVDTSILNSINNSESFITMKSGKYNINFTIENEFFTLENILISGDRISFVDILIEPKSKLSFIEKRKRKKLYTNY